MILRTFLMTVACAALGVGQVTWYVDVGAPGPGTGTLADPFVAIQAGITAATSGDTVSVLPGIYLEHDLDFQGRAISVVGSGGSQVTIVDAQFLGRGFVFNSGEGSSSILQGFKIQHGKAPDGLIGSGEDGGGILIVGASPTILGCEIINCAAGDGAPDPPPSGHHGGGGGGIAVFAGSPTIQGCRIANNQAGAAGLVLAYGAQFGLGGRGGGIFADASSPTLIDCVIEANQAGPGRPGGHGGGIAGYGGSWTVQGCDILVNQAGDGDVPNYGNTGGSGGSGGGLYFFDSTVTIQGSLIQGNTSGDGGAGTNYGSQGGFGGGIATSGISSNLTVTTSRIESNSCGSSGAGLYTGIGSPGASGGGIRCVAGTVSLQNCTILYNTAAPGYGYGSEGGSGGGILSHAPLVISKCVLTGNTAGNGGDGDGGRGGAIWAGSQLHVAGSRVVGNAAGNGSLPSGLGGRGGGIYAPGNPTVLISCVLALNQSGQDFSGQYAPGGGIDTIDAQLLNCTVAFNTGAGIAGGLAASGVSSGVVNSIFWGNGATQIAGTVATTFSDVEGGYAGAGNINTDPLFIDVAAGDFHVLPTSLCVDAADNASVNSQLDIDGDPRIFHGTVDMGADETVLALLAAQTGGPGTPLQLTHYNLTTGSEYYTLFSLDLCAGGPGTGPLFGLCVTTQANLDFMLEQLLAPLGTPILHFSATSSSMGWGPYLLPPLAADELCFEFTGATIGFISPVHRIVVQ
jgi:hypothetical protein